MIVWKGDWDCLHHTVAMTYLFPLKEFFQSEKGEVVWRCFFFFMWVGWGCFSFYKEEGLRFGKGRVGSQGLDLRTSSVLGIPVHVCVVPLDIGIQAWVSLLLTTRTSTGMVRKVQFRYTYKSIMEPGWPNPFSSLINNGKVRNLSQMIQQQIQTNC